MNGWVVRGLGLALVHVVVRTFLGAAVTQWPQQGSVLRWFSLILVILAAFLWGVLDGIRDRRAHADPDESADLTMMWLKAAAVAGVLSGAAAWIVGLIFDIAITNGSLFFEVTSGAAFTILLVFIPATIGVGLGRFLVGRESRSAAADDVAYAHDADVDVEESAAENYAGSEWSYEHGTETGYGYTDDGHGHGSVPADNTDTEVFAPIDPDGRAGGAHRADT
ncbi:B-4DMT family transporter [Prescottella defluvii]|uniref:B-4DMT family transporter n=1 Tax=Prescottella defluvii TaxID=1323361 RepID=UPI0004F3D79D|nr:B-4DMT family transporter [Prescottella defluvii]